MDASSSGDKDGDSSSVLGGTANLHDHSDLLIPNPSFLSSPASSTSSSSMMMSITSPSSDFDLQSKHMDYQMTSPQEHMSCEGDAAGSQMDFPLQQTTQADSSPPNVIIDDSPLQPCMDRNKESLKVKLLMRRPMNQLVEQGILPPPKTPVAFAGQRVRLERARMGDLLKAKIQQRPARQELIRQHILEDTDCRVAPSLAEKQRMLKRARLADSLNDHLIHRPGPLELVQKNILHAPDADIEKAIKDGIVNFKATSEGHVPGPSLPSKYTVNEDDSSSDISSPAGTPDALSSGPNTEANTPISKQPSDSAISLPSAPTPPTTEVCDVTLQPAKTNKSETSPQLILTTTIPSPVQVQPKLTPAAIFHVTTPTAVIPPPPPLPPAFIPTSIPPPPPPPQTIVLSDGAVRELLPQLQSAGFQLAASHVQKPLSQSSSLGKSRSSKKSSKGKSQPKTRTIKFHEYKGPSSLQQKSANSPGTSSSAQSKAESSYELLLKQQQLFLQWQLEWHTWKKYPQILLPAAPKVPGIPTSTSSSSTKTMSSFPVTTIPASLCTNLINNQQSSSQQPTATIAVATASGNASQKPIPVTLAPKVADIAPKPLITETSSESKPVSNEITSTPSTSDVKPVANLKPINLSNINEWKVNDLKAELKKRSMPVSGSKSQLVERLKAAAAKESDKPSAVVPIKMEVNSADENSSEGMDCGGGIPNDDTDSSNKGTNATPNIGSPAAATVVIGTSSPENSSVSILDLANRKLNGVPISLQNILTLLGVSTTSGTPGDAKGLVVNNNNPTADNNLKNAAPGPANSTTAKVISQLPISAVVATVAKPSSTVGNAIESCSTKFVDENKIMEQEKQIEDLQEALRISQQQLQQLAQQKDSKNGGPQKYRLVLQQHIQQKLQQQAFQNQLQNLIQLQTQQAELKRQHQLLQQQQLQQQAQQQQQQPQLVLIRGNNNQPVTIANNVLPVTIVSSAQVVGTNHQNWLQEEGGGKATLSQSEQNPKLNITELVQEIDPKDIKLEPVSDSSAKSGIKSQMVDDVLEILIRNGELPPSAAQDPHTKTSSTPSVPGSDVNTRRPSSSEPVQPPPPPPLPPPTFSVMLPTTIPFSRHHTVNNTDFLAVGTSGRPSENLSKDAQEILRICEDLSNFGKCQEAEAAAAAAANMGNNPATSTAVNCGFFTISPGGPAGDIKGSDLSISAADSMDVGFGDTHSSASTGSNKAQSTNHSPHHHPNNLFQNAPTTTHFDSGAFSFGQQHHVNPSSSLPLKPHSGDQQSHYMGEDELLPVSLDMQMDTDYSDWLDALLPDSASNQAHNVTPAVSAGSNLFPMDHHNAHQTDSMSSGKGISAKRQDIQPSFLQSLQTNDNNNLANANNISNSGNFGIANHLFGSLLDDNSHHEQQQQHHHGIIGQQRDPLLSSRSFATRVTLPFGELQSNSFPFTHQLHHNSGTATGLLFPSIPSSSPSTATLMDTDFDDLASTCSNAKKSENNIILNNVTSNVITEMPSTNPTPITTSSINDNFLWDFAM